ncbi:hypothetical protein PRK78_000515 [Emydomyces testavorans]|uniref:Transcription factor TFIIIC complex subunit Tfc6 n=1 Tax=Emydomyces testavorans TaxID=2070801 RepID=A0AAF0DCM7_9EURO|nr:hypothetical protein PRK78_000515 [Emydomyces testavorans]
MAPRLARRSGRRRREAREGTDDSLDTACLTSQKSDTEQSVSGEDANGSVSDEDFATDEDNGRGGADEADDDVDDFDDEAGSAGGLALGKEEQAEQRKSMRPDPRATRSRGLHKPAEHAAKNTQLKLTFGTSVEDQLPVIYARDHWAYGRDSTFPSAESFQGARKSTAYGIGASFCYDSNKLSIESTKAWDWYYDTAVGGRLLKKQHLQDLEKDARQKYLPRDKSRKHTVLVGPAGKQKAFHLGCNEFFDFGTAWESPEAIKVKQPQPKKSDVRSHYSSNVGEDNASGMATISEPEKIREGWILNLGNKIQCAAWAPNCTDTSQYLAVAVCLPEMQKAMECDMKLMGAPAFTPSPPYPAAIQIWSFRAKPGEIYPRPLDMSCKPQLRLVLCTEFGDVKRLCWCPMPRKSRALNTNGKELNLGLLAGIWGDGSVRVLDVQLKLNSTEAQWALVKVETPFFQAKPPSTLCTSLTWISPSDLAAGCSNGFIGVWSLAIPCDESQSSSVAYIYTPIHTTYILNIVSAYPNHPYLLASTGIDGQVKICSLLQPQVDVAEGIRSRMGTSNFSYSPFCQAFVTTDETDLVRLQPTRRFFSTIAILRSVSNVTAIAPCSPCHPTILVGSADGSVIAANPLRRLLNSKNKHFQQVWFSHEWVHATDSEDGERLGASRFYDGFKAESLYLLRSTTQGKLSSHLMTIYEEETGITVLACNPNEEYAGWTCAGMGCGLLRLEDLTLRPPQT